MHYKVDYDEMIFNFAGPGVLCAVKEPGTLTWVPNGGAHYGPREDFPEGYLTWMLESRPTMCLTDVGLKVAQLMETDLHGPYQVGERNRDFWMQATQATSMVG